MGEIVSSRKVVIPACKVVLRDGRYSLVPGVALRDKFRGLMEYAYQSRGGYISATYDLPRRPRTSGRNSQNNHIWGHATQLAEETGNDVDDVMREAKHRAVSRGYPVVKDSQGEPVRIFGTGQFKGESSADISVEECSILIEELHRIADEFTIILDEGGNEE